MANTELDTPPNLSGRIKNFARSRDGWTMIAAFAICVISSIFMAGRLPVEDTMIIAGLLRMGAGIYAKFSKRGS